MKSTFTSFYHMYTILVTFNRSLSSIHFRKRASEPRASEASGSKRAKLDCYVSISAYLGHIEDYNNQVLQAMQTQGRA